MASDDANDLLNPADSDPVRICEKCSAAMKQLGELRALSIRVAIKVFRCYACDHVVSEPG
jgi:predicted nucleic acid-binding Zn ribbon protein